MAVAGVITNLAICFGYDVDPQLTAATSSGLFAFYILVEGLVDAIK